MHNLHTNIALQGALLDKEYREKRFGDYNTFSKYIDNNIKEINALSFSKYLVNNYNEYKEYICADAIDL